MWIKVFKGRSYLLQSWATRPLLWKKWKEWSTYSEHNQPSANSQPTETQPASWSKRSCKSVRKYPVAPVLLLPQLTQPKAVTPAQPAASRSKESGNETWPISCRYRATQVVKRIVATKRLHLQKQVKMNWLQPSLASLAWPHNFSRLCASKKTVRLRKRG